MPLTTNQLMAISEGHCEGSAGLRGFCRSCYQSWPCDVDRVVGAYTDLINTHANLVLAARKAEGVLSRLGHEWHDGTRGGAAMAAIGDALDELDAPNPL